MNSQNTGYWHAKNLREIQQHELHSKTNCMECCARHRSGRYLLLHFLEKSNESILIKCWKPWTVNHLNKSHKMLFSRGMRLLLISIVPSGSFKWNVFKFMAWKIWSSTFARKITPLHLAGLLCVFVKDDDDCYFSPELKHRKRTITTAIKTICSKILSNVLINFENRLHADVPTLGGSIQHQWNSTFSSLSER